MFFENGNQALFAFINLSKICNDMVWDFLKRNEEFESRTGEKLNNAIINLNRCQSEIEKIFYLTLQLYILDNGFKCYVIEPQYKVSVKHMYYVADFMIFDSKNPAFLLIVECDGHEFHEKTRKQVANDNNRDYELKSAGYDVLHFSGSEIYNDPTVCAVKVIDYIRKHEGRR